MKNGNKLNKVTDGIKATTQGPAKVNSSWFRNAWDRIFGKKPKGVQANKAAGDAVRDVIAARESPALIEQNLGVSGGLRRVDVLKQGERIVAIESKVDRTSLGKRGGSSAVRQELARDIKLLRSGQVDEVVWEFTRSAVTGKVGPTTQLLEKLIKFGITVRINN